MVAAVLLLVLFAATGWRLSRWEGGAILAAYVGYLLVQFAPSVRASLGFV
jgi:Ca2+/Na+ antiporter